MKLQKKTCLKSCYGKRFSDEAKIYSFRRRKERNKKERERNGIVTWYKEHEVCFITAMFVLNVDPIFRFVSAFDFGNGHHDHVIVVAIWDQLIAATLNDFLGALKELEGGCRIALDKHVATGRLLCNNTRSWTSTIQLGEKNFASIPQKLAFNQCLWKWNKDSFKRSLTFDSTVFLLDFHNFRWSRRSFGSEWYWGLFQPSLPFWHRVAVNSFDFRFL